ncbi:PspA/IM30 family protein [Staphylococcus chromogenes]|nr:PspA/IM30 family protein [Staphylococcus chromogenes]
MANPLSKGWKYLTASLDQKIDENADPKVQIQQATEAAKKQHQEITEHAAAVIGNQRQLEMQLDRLVKQQAQLQDKARQAIQLADCATDPEEQAKYTHTAEIFASQLVACEQQLADTKAVYSQAQAAAEQAKKQQQESELRLKEQLTQIDELRAQADQAAMQESTAKAMDTVGQFKEDDSVPTLDEVRAKIERRYANALGAQELTQNSMSGRMAEIQSAGVDFKANERLEQIRAELASGKPAQQGELTEGTDAADSK